MLGIRSRLSTGSIWATLGGSLWATVDTGAVLVQRARMVAELWGPADDGAGGASSGRGAAVGAGTTVGADGAVPAALSHGLCPRVEPGGAGCVRTRAGRGLC